MSDAAPTIMVVEDDAELRGLVETSLGQAGYRVMSAEDAAQAVLLLAGRTPDLALLDMMLPEGSGFQVLSAIRETFRLSVPVLMMSAFGSDAHRQYAAALGANDFVVKPFSIDHLLATVSRFFPQPTAPTVV